MLAPAPGLQVVGGWHRLPSPFASSLRHVGLRLSCERGTCGRRQLHTWRKPAAGSGGGFCECAGRGAAAGLFHTALSTVMADRRCAYARAELPTSPGRPRLSTETTALHEDDTYG